MKWTNVKRKLSELEPWTRNPRQINESQAKRLQESFDEFGQVETIAIGPDNEIYNGHQRLNVLIEKHGGDYEVECRQSGKALSEKDREKLTVFLHKGAAGEWDWDMLANEFEYEELLDWGFDEGDLIGWEQEEKEAPEPRIDEAEKLQEKWGVESEQLWQLGEHRVICGDCTDREVVDRLMDGKKVDTVFTDPPYGINRKGIQNDNLSDDEFDIFNGKWINIIPVGETAVFVCYHSTRNFPSVLIQSLNYGWKFERMLWFYRPDKFPAHTWNGWIMVFQAIMLFQRGNIEYLDVSPADQDTYRYTAKDLGVASGHPTEKILDQCQKVICHLKGTRMYDPFLGSGTTLIACERLNRKCYGVEIEPKYVAVTIERWHEMTGEEPILLDG